MVIVDRVRTCSADERVIAYAAFHVVISAVSVKPVRRAIADEEIIVARTGHVLDAGQGIVPSAAIGRSGGKVHVNAARR